MNTVESIAAAAKDRAWHAYRCEPHRSLADIAAVELGVARETFRRWRIGWGWPPRAGAVAAARRELALRLPGLDPALTAMVPLSLLAAADPGGRASVEDSHAEDSRAKDLDFKDLDFKDLARRMRRLLFGHLDRFAPGDFDRTTKTLATIPKTVEAIQALERLAAAAREPADDPDGSRHDEPPPRSLEELRQELARHLDRLADEEALERGFGDPDEDGAGVSP
jgi:hypothetical protein